jgi:hypothetical protein
MVESGAQELNLLGPIRNFGGVFAAVVLHADADARHL